MIKLPCLVLMTLVLGGCSIRDDTADAKLNNASNATYAPDALDNEMVSEAAIGENETSPKHQPGDQCLSIWSGSSDTLIAAVKTQLRDPDSFEHISTELSPVTETGQRLILMSYRAHNGFGGMNVEEAAGALNPANCHVTLISSKSALAKLIGKPR